MNRLANYLPKTITKHSQSLEAVEGQELTLLGFRLVDGNYGPYAFIDAKDENGNSVIVRTGAFYVLQALEEAKNQNAFPCQAKFVRSGRTWIIT